jgi:hypothetical protein
VTKSYAHALEHNQEDLQKFMQFLVDMAGSAEPRLSCVTVLKTTLQLDRFDASVVIIKEMAQSFGELLDDPLLGDLDGDDLLEIVSSGWIWVLNESTIPEVIIRWMQLGHEGSRVFQSALQHVNWHRWTNQDTQRIRLVGAAEDLVQQTELLLRSELTHQANEDKRWRSVIIRIPLVKGSMVSGDRVFRMGRNTWNIKFFPCTRNSTNDTIWYALRLALLKTNTPDTLKSPIQLKVQLEPVSVWMPADTNAGKNTAERLSCLIPIMPQPENVFEWDHIGAAHEWLIFPVAQLGSAIASRLVVDGSIQCELRMTSDVSSR